MSTLPPEHFAVLKKVFTDIPFNKALGMQLEALENDSVAISFAMTPTLVGNYIHRILHGGVISSVLDMAGGMAIMVSAVQRHQDKDIIELAGILGKASTVDLHVNFIKPGRGESFTAKAWALHSGNKLSFARMELYNNDSTLIAAGSGAYAVG